MKFVESIVGSINREKIVIYKMQFASVPGQGTTDAIFTNLQLQEKFLSLKDHNCNNVTLYLAFIDL